MAVYYIDSINGSDSNDGSSISTAWATLAKGITSGHDTDGSNSDTTLHLAPNSIFREIVASGETQKSVGYRCYWIGDREANVFTSHIPGPVIITDITDPIAMTSAGSSVMGTSNRTNYINLDIYAVGSTTGTALASGASSGRPIDATGSNCLLVASFYGASRSARLENCVVFGGNTAVSQNLSIDKCLLFGGTLGATQMFGDITNCIGVGSTYAFYNTTSYNTTNCTAIGSSNAFRSVDANRCFAFSSGIGLMTNNSTDFISSSVAYACQIPMHKGAHYNISSSIPGVATSTQYGQQVTSASREMFWDYDSLMQVPALLMPVRKREGIDHVSKLYEGAGVGWDTAGIGNFSHDIYSSSYSKNEIGAIAQDGTIRYDLTSSINTAISASHPGIIFQSYGEKLMQLPVPSGSAITASVAVKYTGTVDAAEKPAIVISYPNTVYQTVRAVNERAITTAGADTWSNIVVSASAQNIDLVYDLRLQFYSTGSSVEAFFSDLSIT
jgi:hypothetical protein